MKHHNRPPPSLQAIAPEGTSTSQHLPWSHGLRRSPTEIIDGRCCIGKTSAGPNRKGKTGKVTWIHMDDGCWSSHMMNPYLYQGRCSNPSFLDKPRGLNMVHGKSRLGIESLAQSMDSTICHADKDREKTARAMTWHLSWRMARVTQSLYEDKRLWYRGPQDISGSVFHVASEQTAHKKRRWPKKICCAKKSAEMHHQS